MLFWFCLLKHKSSYDMRISVWSSDVCSSDLWLDAPGLPRHVMRYEDMVADIERSMRGLLAFLRVPVKDGQMRRAIRAASFESLQKQEREKGFQIGRASCRKRVCQYVSVSVVAVALKKQNKQMNEQTK